MGPAHSWFGTLGSEIANLGPGASQLTMGKHPEGESIHHGLPCGMTQGDDARLSVRYDAASQFQVAPRSPYLLSLSGPLPSRPHALRFVPYDDSPTSCRPDYS